jgi:hypothetical protein
MYIQRCFEDETGDKNRSVLGMSERSLQFKKNRNIVQNFVSFQQDFDRIRNFERTQVYVYPF